MKQTGGLRPPDCVPVPFTHWCSMRIAFFILLGFSALIAAQDNTPNDNEKKALAAPPKVNTGVDQRFAASLAEELAQVRVELRAILGR